MSLNPTKISGACGRLMCCLKYEQDAYEYLNKITPRVGSLVDTPEGRGTVTEVSLLTGMLKVSLSGNEDALPVTVKREDAVVLGAFKGGCKRGCPKQSAGKADDVTD